MRRILFFSALLMATVALAQQDDRTLQLVWSDEFNVDGSLDSLKWNFEHGYVRNHEAQWYQSGNASCHDGLLVIEARLEEGAHHYTSASVNTRDKFDFLYGRLEVRAKIPTAPGSWPAIWTLGTQWFWPSCGEIDIMESYRINNIPHILANAAWGNDRPFDPVWNSQKIPFSHFLSRDPQWADHFHIWRMDWDEHYIRIYLDDELLNAIPLEKTVNGTIGRHTNPFHHPHYLLLNLALGGDCGGPIDDAQLPLRYEIDYVRVYQ